MENKIAKVAVASAVFSFDKPFDYLAGPAFSDLQVGARVLVPFGQANKPTEGFVLALQEISEEAPGCKEILYLYRDGICLNKEEISLALWMRSRYFCSFFECANAMLPPGLWQRVAERYKLAPEKANCTSAGRKKAAVCAVLKEKGKAMSLRELQQATGLEKLAPEIRALLKEGFLIVERAFSGKSYQRTIVNVSLSSQTPDDRMLGRGTAREKRLAVLTLLREKGELPEKEICYQTGVQPAVIRDLVRKGLVRQTEVPAYLAVEETADAAEAPFVLSEEQQAVFEGLCALQDQKKAACALLQGVTGSGKTAVYIELIRRTIEAGKSALVLVPEIALTPQMLRGFRRQFGSQVAVLHSSLPETRRYEEYMRVRTGMAKVVVGTRSAVFAPCVDLGLIVIDEEHETTYRSDAAPRYNAVEVAKYRCAHAGCLLLLGSATPSVESAYSVKTGRYAGFTLEHRFNAAPLPQTIIADLKEDLRQGSSLSMGSVLREELEENLRRKEQSILFINRRGNAKMAMCAECGFIPQCRNCSAALTYHSANRRLMCHHCGYSIPWIESCPECGSHHIKMVGAGTQKIEDEISGLFPKARVLRMDADTTTGRRSHEEILDAFARGEADILLGTQMVAKGLDFPNVTLVGVLDADQALNSGSYLAGEHCFSLISQVIGRAGRREKPGRAVIQSFSPNHPIIEAAARQDYAAFYQYEIDIRKLVKAPPFYDIFTFFISAEDEMHAENAANVLTGGLKAAFRGKYAAIEAPVLGPVPAAIAKLSNKYRFIVTFKGKDSKMSRSMMADMLNWFAARPESRGVSVAADINANNF